ncbi:hypothetical protein GS415_00640 [Rhodococcus hoagii]|nr:hypothetical protein [Prescottella equi]
MRFDGWAKEGEVFRDEWGLGFEYHYREGERRASGSRIPTSAASRRKRARPVSSTTRFT